MENTIIKTLKEGGNIIFEGTPENLIKSKNSHTGIFLKSELIKS